MQEPEAEEIMPDVDDLEIYRLVFELFDRDMSGYIDQQDLAAIALKIGQHPHESKSCFLTPVF